MMNKTESQQKSGNSMSAKLQSLSELKKALNKKLSGSTEEIRNSPFTIVYTDDGVDLIMGSKKIKSYEDKGKALNAVWNRDWDIILSASKEYGKTQRRKKTNDIPE